MPIFNFVAAVYSATIQTCFSKPFNIKIVNCPSTPFGSRQRDMNFEFFSSHFLTPTKNYPTMVFVAQSVITEIIPMGKIYLVYIIDGIFFDGSGMFCFHAHHKCLVSDSYFLFRAFAKSM